MVALSAPRDARSKTPPGPEGSNGIDRRGRRGQPAGPPPFLFHVFPRTAGLSLHGPVATGPPFPRRWVQLGAAATVSIDAGAGASRQGRRLFYSMFSREQPACHCMGPWRRAHPFLDGGFNLARQQRYRSTRAPRPAGRAAAFSTPCLPANSRPVIAWTRGDGPTFPSTVGSTWRGSNGIDRRGRRGQPAGPPPFPDADGRGLPGKASGRKSRPRSRPTPPARNRACRPACPTGAPRR